MHRPTLSYCSRQMGWAISRFNWAEPQGATTLVIKNYIEQGDSMTLVFNQASKSIMSLQLATYLIGPSDVVTLAVQFSRLPARVNYVSDVQVNGVSKQMTVALTTFNYQLSQM